MDAMKAIHIRLDYAGVPRKEKGDTLSATYRIQLLTDQRDRLLKVIDGLQQKVDQLEDADYYRGYDYHYG